MSASDVMAVCAVVGTLINAALLVIHCRRDKRVQEELRRS